MLAKPLGEILGPMNELLKGSCEVERTCLKGLWVAFFY